MDIRWSGGGNLKEILVYRCAPLRRGVDSAAAIYGGHGDAVDEIAVPAEILDGEQNVSGYPGSWDCGRADVWGDSRHEVIVIGRNGVHIHANRRPLSIPTLYNSTLYHGM
jgi:hypothetical protein